jgi:hypothetical protein
VRSIPRPMAEAANPTWSDVMLILANGMKFSTQFPHSESMPPLADRGQLLSIHEAVSPTRAGSLDHLVGEQLHRIGHGETECIGGLQVDHQLELCRLHDRQIGRLGAFEDAADVAAGLVI